MAFLSLLFVGCFSFAGQTMSSFCLESLFAWTEEFGS